MAEYKKSVIIYTDLIHTFEELSDAEAGRLIKHFFRYVNDKNPIAPDKITKIAFEPIKQQLKRDLKKWEDIRVKRSDAGKVSAELKKQQKSTKSTHVESDQQTSTNSTVNATVNVNDTVINKEEGDRDEKKIIDFTTNQRWKEEFCQAKNISPAALEKLQHEFLVEKRLTGESIYSYKRYFLFWFNKKQQNGTHQQTNRKSGKPGKSDGANMLLADVVKQVGGHG